MKYYITVAALLFVVSLYGQDDKLKMPDVPGDLMVDVGLNYWSTSSDSLQQEGWPSKSVGIYFVKRKGLSEKFSFTYGLGLGLDKISLGKTHTLFSGKDEAYVGELPVTTIDKNRLATTYLDVPLELRFYPKGTEEGEGFFVSAGAIGGVFLTAHTKWTHEDTGENVTEKTSGRFDINTFRYAAQFRIGFKGIHVFYKHYFNETFRNSVMTRDASGAEIAGSGFNPTTSTIGINITGF